MARTQKREIAILNKKNDILDAAEQLFVAHGYESTTLRKIAATIKVNPATIYNYYKNKEEIFYALQERAFTKFYEEFQELRNSKKSGKAKLKQMGRKYINFALKNQNYYELMFILKKPMNAAERIDPEWKIGAGNYTLLKEIIQQCIDEKSIKVKEVDSGAFMIWSMVHGIVSLIIMERCQMMLAENLEFVMADAFSTFEKLLEQ